MYILFVSITSIHIEVCHHAFVRSFIFPSCTCPSYLPIGPIHTWLKTWMIKCAWPSTICSSHLSMEYSHTWLRTWTSRSTCAITQPSTTCLTHLPMGFLPYLAEHLDEQRHLCEPDHLLPIRLICRWDFSHTWLRTWTSRGTWEKVW